MKNLSLVVFVLFVVYGCNVETTKNPPSIDLLAKRFEDHAKSGLYFLADSINTQYRREFIEDSAFMSKLDSLYEVFDSTRNAALKQKEEDRKVAKFAAEKAKRKLRTFRKNTDEFSGLTYYQHKTSPRYVNRNGFYCYFGMDKDERITSLRLKVQYHADDWLFIQRCEILVDGDKSIYSPGAFKRDNDEMIWEVNDSPVDEKTMSLLEDISNSRVSKIRFVGNQYHKDKTITSAQKRALKEVIEVYKALSNPLL